MSSYVPLWCKSNFSFLEGASHPEELVEEANLLGLRTLALTDRDGVHGIVRAWVKAKELGVRLIVGSQVSLEDGSTIVLLAQDRAGYANLSRLITAGRMRSAKGESSVSWQEVCEHSPGLIALWGGERCVLTQEAESPIVGQVRDAFGERLYAMLARHICAAEARPEARLKRRAARFAIPTVAAIEVLYHTPARRTLQDVMTCIRHRVTLDTAGLRLRANGEHALVSDSAMAVLYPDVREAVARTGEVASRCTFDLRDLRYRYPSQRLPDGMTTAQRIRHLVNEGAKDRYPSGVPDDVAVQLEKELALIEKLDFCGYFLGMWEIVRYCRENGILCQGRGSAANSAVCYCLRITAIDPVRMGLLFERFISEERAEPPDIDLDIQHDRREEVIQHVYRRYGRTHAAMVANLIRYQPRSAVRDVGKALGIPVVSLDRLSKLLAFHGRLTPELLFEAGIDPDHPTHRHLAHLVNEIIDFPRHLGIHPGGFVLGHEPIDTLVPTENATMPERTVVQWDKYDVEELGLFKVDLLGLGALTLVDLAFKLMRQHLGQDFSLATIPQEDPATYAMLSRGDTVGAFQVESRAQMAMLPRLKPKNFYDIVIEISIVRPGPITGGMVHPYLRRRSGEEEVIYPHDSLKPVLQKTLGVPLFQEQVMKLAVVAADYTPGEADQLRRDMAAWRRSGRIETHRERLVSRMQVKGIKPEFAERVFDQIRGFGEYGFPESHAASFALIAYATCWLKCHHPAIFACAILNAQPMGFYSAATLIEDAKRHGVIVLPIDVSHSRWDCTLEPLNDKGFAVRMGLRYVKAFGEGDWNKIESAFAQGAFVSLPNFIRRTGLDKGALIALAQCGAFDGFGVDRRQALWVVRGEAMAKESDLPLLDRSEVPAFPGLNPFDLVNWDYRHSEHSARGHPMAGLRKALSRLGLPDAKTVGQMPNGRDIRYAGVVINRQRPGTAKGVVFMTLEDETGFVNLIVWERVFAQYATLAKTALLLGVTGRLQARDGVTHLVAEALWAPFLDEHMETRPSRDFH